MLSRLSMQNLLAALIISAAAGFGASVGVTAIRQAGAPLDPSIQNEVGHAVGLAAEWLAACQNADGSWGSETGRVRRTAVALLALQATRSDRYSDASARAAVWLDSHRPSTNELADASAFEHAWRIIALLSVAPDTPARANLTQRLLEEARPCAPETNAWFFTQLIWADALSLAKQRTTPLPQALADNMLKAQAADWPPDAARPPYCLWLPTHLINRMSGGTLTRDGEPLDWRRDVAQILINAQRRAPSGGAFWGASESSDRVWQTAFGILTLSEL